jgi:predicted ATP-grasp superfamily ATP-dependent carboligase
VKLLIIEFITAGGCHGDTLPAALAEEGEFMLEAVLRDAALLPGMQVTVPRDARLSRSIAGVDVVAIAGDPWEIWRQLMTVADAVLVIAPETDGALQRLVELVDATNTLRLGSDANAVAVSASKRETANRLAMHGVPVAPTVMAGDPLPASARGWVIKPDDGVGSEDVWFTADEVQVRIISGRVANAVVQPFIAGEPVSLSLLCAGNACRLLACNRQLREDSGGRLRQIGVEVNGSCEHHASLAALAGAVAAAMPGLRGYVGIDAIVTDDGPVVIEVNPRLTTAYAGLSESLQHNMLALLVAACRGDRLPFAAALAANRVRLLPHG